MTTKDDLKPYVIEALRALGGSGSVVEVCREIWQRHELDLRQSGDLFFTWQYDVRWAAQALRDQGALAPTPKGSGSKWSLSS